MNRNGNEFTDCLAKSVGLIKDYLRRQKDAENKLFYEPGTRDESANYDDQL